MSLETKDQEDVEVSKDSGTEEMIEEWLCPTIARQCPTTRPAQGGETLKEAEKEEEAKLKAKYPQVCRPGGSSFLQKRLQKGMAPAISNFQLHDKEMPFS
ncbi:ENSA [Cordylochernes scorpioides]|uniref:ENSA n=1 Tax=Cordylochernes scorpioides TaxID=51811 RepID=A0ABY6L9Q6_9ARAC|nr:ENSA [Cordylochernes scorpioides]